MRRTTWVLLLILVGLSGWVAYGWTQGSAPVSVAAVTPTRVEPTPAPGREGVTAASMLTELRSRYRLAPDARFVQALRIIAAFPAAPAESLPPPRYEAGAWIIPLGEGEARFPDLPSFEQAVDILSGQATQAVQRLPLLPDSADLHADTGYAPTVLLREVAQLNAKAQRGISPALLRTAAGVTCRLAISTPDETETADLIPARCLALTVLAQAASGKSLPEEMSMAAKVLEYDTDAFEYANQLPDTRPWRDYLEARHERLALAARGGGAAHYLYVRHLAARGRGQSWHEAIQQGSARSSMEMVATGLRLGNIGLNYGIGVDMPGFVYNTLGGPQVKASFTPRKEAEPQAKPTADLFVALEKAMGEAGKEYQGPFYYTADHQALYRAYLYTGMRSLAHTALFQHNVVEKAESLGQFIANSNSPDARQFARWYQHLIDAEQGRADKTALRADLIEVNRFGEPMLDKTMDALAEQYDPLDPVFMDLVGDYAKRLDSRLAHRYQLANRAYRHLMAHGVAADLYRSVVMADPTGVSPWVLNYFDMRDDLQRVAADGAYGPWRRAQALEFLADGEGFDPQVVKLFQQLIAEQPLEWSVRKRLVDYLVKFERHGEALDEAQRWVAFARGNGDVNAFDYWKGVIAVSDAYLRMGDRQRAWVNIQPLLDTEYGGAYDQAIEVLLELGRVDKARRLADEALQRYPNSFSALGNWLAAHWAGGHYDAAAQRLAQWKHPAGWFEWQTEVGEPFARVLAKNPAEALKAMDAMVKAGVDPWQLQTLAESVSQAGNPQLAFDLQSMLPAPGSRVVPVSLRAYLKLKKAQGEETALAWLNERLRGVPVDFATSVTMEIGGHELLWTMVDPAKVQYPTAVWLYRASAYAMGKPTTAEQFQALRDYYASAGDDRYDLFGKYLMGLIPEEQIASMPLDKRGISEATFYLALGAAQQGRYSDMADWMRVSLDTRDRKNGEYRWATNLLTRWRQGKSIEHLAKEGDLFY